MISLIIRTYNEQTFLEELLTKSLDQEIEEEVEVVIVDSGSTDNTLEIANKFPTNIVHIKKEDFSFGRSLNLGIEAAKGDIVVMISGHCIPYDKQWLKNLVAPIRNGKSQYTYGRQIGGPKTKYSENKLFDKYYGAKDRIPQNDFFCNNANSALSKSAWEEHSFDEDLTGLEDMDLAKKLFSKSKRSIGYCSQATVIHHHDETWSQVKTRYEREALALQSIMPEVHLTPFNIAVYFIAGVFYDTIESLKEGRFFSCFFEIIKFRFMQYLGAYLGNRQHRKLSNEQKYKYFYPKTK